MPPERFLRIDLDGECAHSVSAANSITFDSRKAASSRGKTDSRKMPLLLRYPWLIYWLGREDSNLRMAESKSDYSARNINAHFEKTAEYGLNSINRLALPSKCSPLSCCLESSTRSKLAYQSPTHRSASITSGLFRPAQTMNAAASSRCMSAAAVSSAQYPQATALTPPV
jgi:hypothetical protein